MPIKRNHEDWGSPFWRAAPVSVPGAKTLWDGGAAGQARGSGGQGTGPCGICHPQSFPRGSDGKESPCNAGDPGSIPGSGRCPGEGMAIHSSILLWRIPWTEQPGYSPWGHKEMDTTRWLTLHLGKALKAFLVAQTVKHLPTMPETRVRSLVRKILLRRKWQPTPVLLPGKSHGQRSLVGYSLWGHKESDTTEWLHFRELGEGKKEDARIGWALGRISLRLN